MALAITAVGATAVAMVFLGTGIAAADDYSGQTYGDASKAISVRAKGPSSPAGRVTRERTTNVS